MAKVCILQPNFIPWMGYFDIINSCDICIIYDTAQFSKNTFHNRNNIRLKNGDIFTWTLPLKKYQLGSNFNEILVEHSSPKLRKLSSLLFQNYSKSKYYYILEELLQELSVKSSLAHLNFFSIQKISEALKINTEFEFASELVECEGTAVEKLISLLSALDARSYVTTTGAKPYLDLGLFETHFKGEVQYRSFECRHSLSLTGDSSINLSALSLLIEGVFDV